MHPTDKAARVAGAWYLAMVLTGPFTLLYIPKALIVRGDAAATASKVLAHETMFRLGVAADLVGAVLFVMAGLALYRLLSAVSQTRAAQMVAMVGISATIMCVNTLTNLAALDLFRGGDAARGMLFIRLHSQGNTINEIFWGLWLIPLGMMIFNSGFLPKFIGVWLIVNGFAYVVLCGIGLFAPQYSSIAFTSAQPALFGELVLMLWLLIKGAKVTDSSRESSSPLRPAPAP